MFWLGLIALTHAFAAYPLLVHLAGLVVLRKPGHPSRNRHDATPASVSIVLVVRNEAGRLRGRIENLLDTDYPAEALELIVVSDGSTDEPGARIDRLPARLLAFDTHQGKAACINAGVGSANGSIIVFADARQRFNRQTIPGLVEPFADPGVGAVSGELRIEPSEDGVGVGVDAYWRLEKAIRHGESRIDSCIGCTGAVYAIRKESFTPLPSDTILDDVVCPMQIALKGFRVLFQPDALAYDPQRLDAGTENRRKRRTLAGNFQMLFRYPRWLLPWENRLWVQLISHKYLRLAAPVLLILILICSVILAVKGSNFFMLIGFVQGFFYLLAILGLVIKRPKSRILSIPAAFTFLNCMTVLGFLDFLSKNRKVGW